jgi:CRISPR-associated protein Cmr3
MMTSDGGNRIGLLLEPIEPLFFRDGRPFEPGGQGRSGLPTPQTLAGALRTWLLRAANCDLTQLGGEIKEGKTFAAAAGSQGSQCASVAKIRFRGPWLTQPPPKNEAPFVEPKPLPLVPMPAVLMAEKHPKHASKDPHPLARLSPLQGDLPGWKAPEEGMRPLWAKTEKDIDRATGYLTPEGLRNFVCGKEVNAAADAQQVVPCSELWDFEGRTGIAVDSASNSAQEHMIYGVRLLALKPGVGFYAEMDGPEEALNLFPDAPVTLPFGGEGRRVVVRKTTEPFDWPRGEPTNGQHPFLLLITPGLFNGSWRPACLQGRLAAAAVPKYEAVSGWDLARGGPKPNRFAAAAGSVYFLKEPLEDSRLSLCDGEDAAIGWGTFTEGVWSDV